jgi:hypothetical protein
MVDEIEGIGRKGKSDEPMAWKPWQPPVTAAPGPAPAQAPAPKPELPRMRGDRNGTGPLSLDAAVQGLAKAKAVDLDAIDVPDIPGVTNVQKVKDAATMLGELGVVASLAQVATAYSRTPVSFANMAESLGAFAENMTKVSEQLHAMPGVGEALATFGGVGGVVAGVMGFKEELQNVKQDGLNLANGLGVAASAAQLVGGVATALGALCPPMAPLGASIMAAGAALKLGKLGWENRDKVKVATQNLQSAVERTTRIVGDKGAAIVANNSAALVANNSAAIVANNSAAMSGRPFAWMTG